MIDRIWEITIVARPVTLIDEEDGGSYNKAAVDNRRLR